MIFEPTIKKLCYNYLNLFQVKMETRSRKRKLNPLPHLPKEEPKAKVLKEITEQCKACNQEKVLLRHLGKSPKCRDQYPDYEEMRKNAIKNRNKTYKMNNKEKISTSNRAYYSKNSEKISLQQKQYKSRNRQALIEKQRERNQRYT